MINPTTPATPEQMAYALVRLRAAVDAALDRPRSAAFKTAISAFALVASEVGATVARAYLDQLATVAALTTRAEAADKNAKYWKAGHDNQRNLRRQQVKARRTDWYSFMLQVSKERQRAEAAEAEAAEAWNGVVAGDPAALAVINPLRAERDTLRERVAALTTENGRIGDALVMLEMERRWIHVEERLPKDAEMVFILGKYGIDRGCRSWEQGSDPEHWRVNDHRVYTYDITHWMPLPQVPTAPR